MPVNPLAAGAAINEWGTVMKKIWLDSYPPGVPRTFCAAS
jgi:hypothetical protein